MCPCMVTHFSPFPLCHSLPLLPLPPFPHTRSIRVTALLSYHLPTAHSIPLLPLLSSRGHPLQLCICPSSPGHSLPFRPLLLLPLSLPPTASVTWLLPSHSSHSLFLHVPSLSPLPLSPGYSPPILPTRFFCMFPPFLPLPPSPGYSSPILPTRFFCMFPPFLHRLCHLVTPLPFFPLISSAHSLPFSTAFVTWSLTSHSSHSPRLPATHFLYCSLTAFLTLPSSPGHSFPFLSLPFLMAPLPLPHYITW